MSKESMEVTFDLAEAFKNDKGAYPTLQDLSELTEDDKDYLYFTTLSKEELHVYLTYLTDANQRSSVVNALKKKVGN